MKVSLVRIGNSRGVRIPAKILETLDFKEEVTMEIIDDKGLLLKPALAIPRQGWEKAFKVMHKNKDDELLIDDSLDINLISDLDEDHEAGSSI